MLLINADQPTGGDILDSSIDHLQCWYDIVDTPDPIIENKGSVTIEFSASYIPDPGDFGNIVYAIDDSFARFLYPFLFFANNTT